MSVFIDQLYKSKAQRDSDAVFLLQPGSWHYTGFIDSAVRFIEQKQLLDAPLWALFVNQFRQGNVDDIDEGWRGEYWGKMMRGACFTYQYTQNPALYEVLEGTVRDLLTTQDSLGRFSTYSVEMELRGKFHGWDLWGRKYILLGLQYFCEICRDEELKRAVTDAMCRHADYILAKVGKREDGKRPITETSAAWMGMNSCSILEPFVRLYNWTGEQRYLDFAGYIVETGGISEGSIFELACEDKLAPYQYPVTKAYEMMSCFDGLLEYYRVTKIEKWRTAVENFVRRVLETEFTITGGSGCAHEGFNHSAVQQATAQNDSNEPRFKRGALETCVTVTLMKLCFQLYRLNGDSTLIDAIEQSAYNALLGAINTEGSKRYYAFSLPFDSYSPLRAGTRGVNTSGFKQMENNTFYGCCAAIGSAGTGMLPLISVMAAPDGIVVNLYQDGEVHTKTPSGAALQMRLATDYPVSGSIQLTVQPALPEAFAIRLRIPAWSRETSVAVNGIAQTGVASGAYLELRRVWAPGDTVKVELDMRTVVLPAPKPEDAPPEACIAFKRGPLILARDARLGADIDTPLDLTGIDPQQVPVKPSHTADFPVMLELAIPLAGGDVTVIDYASAGKTWDEASKMAAWLPVRN